MNKQDLVPKVLFEDKSLVVLDKPSGITVNRADTTQNELTVQDWLDRNITYQRLHSKDGEGNTDFINRSGIVHRLDKETSGLLVVAKSEDAFLNLQKQFKERDVKKMYTALVHGILSDKKGEISAPVGRLPWNRMRFGIVAGGRESVTAYEVVEERVVSKTSDRVSLLHAFPKTGRTHQLRVHFKYINHQIFSDPLYGGRKTIVKDRKMLNRLFLHATKLIFFHPENSEILQFESPLPEELSAFLKNETTKM